MIPGVCAQSYYFPHVVSMTLVDGAADQVFALASVFMSEDWPVGFATPVLGEAEYVPGAIDGLVIYAEAPFSSVVMLCGFDGANGQTTFTDESSFHHALTAGGNAKITTTNSKYGSGALLLDGAGDWITTPTVSDFNLGQFFTIEGWINFTDTTPFGIVYLWDYADDTKKSWGVSYQANLLVFSLYDVTGTRYDYTGSWSPVVNTWYFFSICRHVDRVTYLHVDGKFVGGWANTAYPRYVSTSPFKIGAMPNLPTGSGDLDGAGRLDELRITKGYARYPFGQPFGVPSGTVLYPPPTSAFPRS